MRIVMRSSVLVTLLLSGGLAQAHAQPVDPKRIASCQLAAENMRDRVRPETEDYARYNADATFWAAKLAEHVPDENSRTDIVTEGRGLLRQALQQQGYMAGMMMVARVLSQCNAAKGELEAARPNG